MTALCVSCGAMRMLQPTKKENKKGQRKKNKTKKGQKKLCSFLTLPSVPSHRVWRLQRCEHILFTSATETEMVRGARSWGAVGGSAARRESCPPRETAPAWTRCPSTTGASPGRPGRSCCWRRAPMAATYCGTARASRESTASACCECGRPCAAAVASLGCGAAEGGGAGRVVADFQHSHPQYRVFLGNSDKICPTFTIRRHVWGSWLLHCDLRQRGAGGVWGLLQSEEVQFLPWRARASYGRKTNKKASLEHVGSTSEVLWRRARQLDSGWRALPLCAGWSSCFLPTVFCFSNVLMGVLNNIQNVPLLWDALCQTVSPPGSLGLE